jgi:uncharacterized membrane protein YeaQ/YmgE (transglycosylase-associated protein family)
MILNILAWIIIGGLAGWIASKIMKTDASMGIVLNIVVGIIGAIIGGWLISWIFNADPEIFSFGGLLTAILGSVILLAIVKLFTGGRRTTA